MLCVVSSIELQQTRAGHTLSCFFRPWPAPTNRPCIGRRLCKGTSAAARAACNLQPLCRFLVLVTGTLVYGKGDKLEAKREGLLEAGEERVFAPVAHALPGETQPSAVPGQRRSSVGTAPIAMRATPGSLKVRCQPLV